MIVKVMWSHHQLLLPQIPVQVSRQTTRRTVQYTTDLNTYKTITRYHSDFVYCVSLNLTEKGHFCIERYIPITQVRLLKWTQTNLLMCLEAQTTFSSSSAFTIQTLTQQSSTFIAFSRRNREGAQIGRGNHLTRTNRGDTRFFQNTTDVRRGMGCTAGEGGNKAWLRAGSAVGLCGKLVDCRHLL